MQLNGIKGKLKQKIGAGVRLRVILGSFYPLSVKLHGGLKKANAWCDKGYWNGVGCDAGYMLITRGRGKKGGESGEFRIPLRGRLATNMATRLGYTKRIPPQKVPFDSHKQPAFQKGNRYITPDVDGHNGEGWKVFERQGGQYIRRGTYNEDLTVRIGD